LKAQYDWAHAHFLSLDDDRLLKVYRQRAGLPAPGEDMGGWYDADGFVPGHTIGQYISGLARMYATTRDPSTLAKVQALVGGDAAAREMLPRIIRGAIGHIPDHTYDRTPDSPKQAPYDEPYILPENLFNSY